MDQPWEPCLALSSLPIVPARALDSGDFGELHIVRPDGAMHGLVILFSDARGWDAASDKIAAALAHEGVFVAGVDLPTYFRQVGAQANARCSDAVSTIELISREIQRQRRNSTYWTPILAGVGEGGALAAATLAQSPASTIAGAVSLDPTASLKMPVPLCSRSSSRAGAGGGFSYGPWQSLNGFWAVGFSGTDDADGRKRIEELRAEGTPVTIEDVTKEDSTASAMAALARRHLGKSRDISSPAIAGLPLIELP